MSLKERINLVKQQFGISEADTLNIEKALGKKLVDYESIEALVAALMGYYNGELKKKANTSHTHDYAPSSHKHKKADISDFPTSMKNPNALEIKMNGQNPVSYDGAAAKSINITASGIGAYTKTETDEKFKNFCPYAVGDIYITTLSTNPATKYLGTTWQKIEGRFLLGTSGSGASKATGGSNSKTIAQANLPAVKIQLNSFSLSRGTMEITGAVKTTYGTDNGFFNTTEGAFSVANSTGYGIGGSNAWAGTHYKSFDFNASKTWTGTTNTAQPQTVNLGSGSALDITPSYYTVHMWLRLT